jgi:photosystem II stability/assembly factor-like uncharacterized protein
MCTFLCPALFAHGTNGIDVESTPLEANFVNSPFPIRALAVALLVAAACSPLCAQWTRLDPVMGTYFYAATFGDDGVLYFAGPAGITRSIDSGRTGRLVVDAGSLPLSSIANAGRNRLWAVGAGGTVYQRLDEGTWQRREIGTSENLVDIDFSTPAIGLILSRNPRTLQLHRTTDSGATWRQVVIADSNALTAVELRGAVGLAVGVLGTILRTTDAGATWNVVLSDLEERNILYRDVAFMSDSTAIAVGQQNRGTARGWIMRSSNAGRTWTDPVYDVATPSLAQVHFVTPLQGMALDDSKTMMRTSDGGRIWSAFPSPFEVVPRAIEFFDSLYGIAVGGDGFVRITTDGGGTWTRRTALAAGLPYNDVAADRDHRVVAVGARGLAVVGAENETNLRRVTTGVSADLMAAAWAPTGDYVAVGREGVVVRGGASALPVVSTPAGSEARLNDIVIRRDGTGFIVGGDSSGSILLKTVDAGVTWTSQPAPARYELFGIATYGDSDVWVVGYLGLIYRSTDDGATWSDRRYSVTHPLNAIALLDRDNAIVVGESLTMRTTNAGETWSFDELGTRSYKDILFADPRHGVIVGHSTSALITTDGGVTWDSSTAPVGSILNGIAIAGSRLYAVSGIGEIVARDLVGVASAHLPGVTGSELHVVCNGGLVDVTVGASSASIASVVIVDLLGREIVRRNSVDPASRTMRLEIPDNHASGLLFACVTLIDGTVRTHRLLRR